MSSSRAKLSDLVVGVVVLLLLGTFSLAQLGRAQETANRVKCASNLRQIGQAILLYSNDNRGAYPRLVWDKNNPAPTWGTPYEGNDKLKAEPEPKTKDLFFPDKCDVAPKPNDVTAALYLLMRTQDITSGVFVCPSTGLTHFDFGGGKNNMMSWSNWPGKASLADHLSYSMNNPYVSKDVIGKGFKWNNTLGAEYAIAADMNPGVDALTTVNVNSPADQMRKVNSVNHGSDGQNILYGDGHVTWESMPFVGVKRDNIYTFGPSGQDVKEKGGDGIVGSPTTADDSVLLPTAKDLGVIDATGELTAEAKEHRAAALLAARPTTPAEQDAARNKLIGTFTRGGDTLTITTDKLTLTGGKSMTFGLKLAGIERTKAQVNLLSPDDPTSSTATLVIMFHPDGLGISGMTELEGDWKKE